MSESNLVVVVILFITLVYCAGYGEARHRRLADTPTEPVDTVETVDPVSDAGDSDEQLQEPAPIETSSNKELQEPSLVPDIVRSAEEKHKHRHQPNSKSEKSPQPEQVKDSRQSEERKDSDESDTTSINTDFPASTNKGVANDSAIQKHSEPIQQHSEPNQQHNEPNQQHSEPNQQHSEHNQQQGEASQPVKEPLVPVYKSSSCPKCTRGEQEKQLRIEEVKKNILRRLGLASVPKVDSPIHPLPFDFYMGEDFAMNDKGDDKDEDIDEHSVRTREIFIYGKDITDQCLQKKGTGCYSFNITDQIVDLRSIASAELWVYKQADVNDHYIQTFMVSELSKHVKGKKEYLRPRNIVKRIETRLKYGWMKIYVKRAILRWLSKPQRNNGFAVTCQTCKRRSHRAIYGDKEGLMPILVVYMKDVVAKKRVRREVDCTEGGANCCHKEELEITFSEIGWNYIMAPLSIRPNYCVGSCNGQQAAFYNHTKLVQTIRQTIAYNYVNLQPCCSPVSFRRSQSLIYRDNQGVVRKIDIPDLIVGECGCS